MPRPGRIVRRADYVREIEKRVTHREVAVPHRLHPPRIDAGEKVRMRDKVRVGRSLIDDLAHPGADLRIDPEEGFCPLQIAPVKGCYLNDSRRSGLPPGTDQNAPLRSLVAIYGDGL